MAKVLLCLDGTVIKEFRITRDRTSVGRRPSNDIQIENIAVSGEHAVFDRVGRDIFVEDLGSTNGTLVNGKPVQRQLLANGDEITVGKYTLKYWQDAQPAGGDFDKTMIMRPGQAAAPQPAARPAAAPVAHAPAAQAVAADANGPVGVVKVLTGANAGRELLLNKPATTLGKAGTQVAVISKRPTGYFLIHVEGKQHPKVNGAEIGASARQLKEEDAIELMGVQMVFFLR
ncbi:FHA domain-containing protein [Chitinolyticbacter meiyuanensis]|uniref:FHA domain-containing protein n=1 Tax=Chitinolyticbacter meiyuanensis TaxID=682798 RepID=UPI0011E5FEEB|nr:FHA domain-containing protein [Chitinolyticbacter meiyuanensis]